MDRTRAVSRMVNASWKGQRAFALRSDVATPCDALISNKRAWIADVNSQPEHFEGPSHSTIGMAAALALLMAPAASAAATSVAVTTAAQVQPLAGAVPVLLLGLAVGLLIYNLVVACFVRDTVYLWYSLLIFSSIMVYGWWVVDQSLDSSVFHDNTEVAVFAAVFLTVKQRFLECYLQVDNPLASKAISVAYALAVVMMVMIAVSPPTDTLSFLLWTCLTVLMIDLGAVAANELLADREWRTGAYVYLGSVGTFAGVNMVTFFFAPDMLLLASLLAWLLCLAALTVGVGLKMELGGVVERSWSQKYHQMRSQLEDMSRQNTRLRRESHTDGLTKIGNRAHFELSYRVEWDRAFRERLSIALLLVDIDHFKRVNDKYGHVVGDECLVAVALAIRGCLHRASDRVMRYGGEEFVVILGGSSSEGVELIGDRIRAAVKSLEFPEGFRITVSVGGASIVPRADVTGQEFLEMVDQALYRAKNTGRDRLVMAGSVEQAWDNKPTGVLH